MDLPAPGRANHQQIVPASRRYFQRPFGAGLPLDISKIQVGKAFDGQGFFPGSRRQCSPFLIPIQQLADVGDAIYLDPLDQRAFGGVGLREKNPAQSLLFSPQHQRQRTVDPPHLTG